jgi:hypothetical protein
MRQSELMTTRGVRTTPRSRLSRGTRSSSRKCRPRRCEARTSSAHENKTTLTDTNEPTRGRDRHEPRDRARAEADRRPFALDAPVLGELGLASSLGGRRSRRARARQRGRKRREEGRRARQIEEGGSSRLPVVHKKGDRAGDRMTMNARAQTFSFAFPPTSAEASGRGSWTGRCI